MAFVAILILWFVYNAVGYRNLMLIGEPGFLQTECLATFGACFGIASIVAAVQHGESKVLGVFGLCLNGVLLLAPAILSILFVSH